MTPRGVYVRTEKRFGNKSPRWNGGKKHHSDGYIYIYSPTHPYKNKEGYVAEHRLVMEAYLGRVLLPSETVHHINDIRDDNRIENLMLFSSGGEHTKFHFNEKRKLKNKI